MVSNGVAALPFAALESGLLETEMQETGVGWDPMYEGRLPWFSKVFVLYLLLLLLLSAFRAITLVRRLWSLQEIQQEDPRAEDRFQVLWEFCQAKLDSIKQLSMLTFLLSILLLAWRTTDILQGGRS